MCYELLRGLLAGLQLCQGVRRYTSGGPLKHLENQGDICALCLKTREGLPDVREVLGSR